MREKLRTLLGKLAGPAAILAAAGVAVAPQLLRGGSCGHDFDFHLVSWFDALRSWQQGTFYPHWSPSPNYGAGEPRFVFYPPLTWMLGAALGAVMQWQYVEAALTYLMLAAAGLATYALARQALERGPATVAGCAALFSGYSLFNAYERSAFGELTGGFWIPLLLLFALRDARPETTTLRRVLDGSTVWLALTIAGAWLSDVPLGVLACYLLAAVALGAAWLRRSWAPVIRAAAATAVGLALTGVYLLPAIAEQSWVNVAGATDDPGTRVETSWMFARHADPNLDLHDVELFRVSVIGATMLALALACMLIAWKRRRLTKERAWWVVLAAIPVTVLFLQLPISLPVWHFVPKLRMLQFPWRWYVAVQAPMAIFLGAAVWVHRTWLRRLLYAAVGCAAFAAMLVAGLNMYQTCYAEDTVWSMHNVYVAGTGFEGSDEYEPQFADNELLATGLPEACLTATATTKLGEGSAGTTPEWTPEQRSCLAIFRVTHPGNPAAEHLRVDAEMPRAGFVVLRLRSYPAWRVVLNGAELAGLPEREDGLLAVPVPQGPVHLSVDWETTRAMRLGQLLSLAALAAWAGLLVLERQRTR